MIATPALAHPGGIGAGATWWTAWSAPPLVLLNLIVLTALFAMGTRRRTLPRRRVACFAASIATLVVALASPIDALSDLLAWVHMIQHTLLMMIAAPLFIASGPGSVMLAALPRRFARAMWRWRRWRIARRLTPRRGTVALGAWLAFGATLWIWHWPPLYQAALLDPAVHDLQHLAFFVAAAQFWRAVLDPSKAHRIDHGAAILYLFLASLHSTALGALLALSPRLWYPLYAGRTEALGWSPLADQQAAGYLMWMPGCAVYVAVAAILLAALLEPSAPNAREQVHAAHACDP